MDLNGPVGMIVTALLLLGMAIWLGGFVALISVARSVRATLPADQRVAFFRHLGPRYGIVATTALLVALAAGALMLASGPWTAISTALIWTAIGLLCLGVLQARRMTRLRRGALQSPADARFAARIGIEARWALVLRAGIGLVSLALLALGLIRTV